MKYIIIAISLALLPLMQGCSIYKAASSPPDLAIENVKVGKNRLEIASIIGIPKVTDTKDGLRTDMHEFIDGFPNGSKVRIILYIAGDLFTAGLSELLFWPIELAAGGGTDGRAMITYGMDDIAKSVLLTKLDGSPWEFSVNPEETKKITSRVDPNTGSIIQD